jgi:DHA1 family inner membrane transport protein
VARNTLLMTLMTLFTVGNLATVLAPSYGLLVAARFVSGLPHGAFFGVAALVAAHLMGPGQRAKAVAQVMTGPGPRLAQRIRAGGGHRPGHGT